MCLRFIVKNNFVFSVVLFSLFLQSCATTDSISQDPTQIIVAPIGASIETVGNVLEVPIAILEFRKPHFSFGKEARFDRAWAAKDYPAATSLVNDGLDLSHRVNNKSLPYLAAQCIDHNFSRAVVRKLSSLTDFEDMIAPSFKQAIAQNDRATIDKYIDCGYPVSANIESEPLIYWSGFYVSADTASVFDQNGTNSPDYQRGFSKGRDSRIDTALNKILVSHVAGHIFKGANFLSAGWNEAMSVSRKTGLYQFYGETLPELDSEKLKATVIVTELILDGKLSIENLTEKVARDAIKEKLDEVSPGSGTLSNFVYGTMKRMYSANKEAG